jgi:phage terminase large subunit-like protein
MCVPPVSSVTDKAGREVLLMLGPGMRMAAQTAPIDAGAVHLPSHASWIDEFKKETLSFPLGKYDDQVDALSQALCRCLRARAARYANCE